ncbi:MAG: iron ABC transporter permease [Spirochaetes bacterium]|nr:iron ABC transporter permease [Spirochaetota bacterium]
MKKIYEKSNKKWYFAIFISLVILGLFILLNLLYIPAGENLTVNRTILFQLRIPRIIIAILAGAGLSIVGASFQGLFKNPLAEPYLLGISAGSALGAIISFFFNLHKIPYIGEFLVIINSFICGLGTMMLVIFISRFRKRFSMLALILTGVIMNAFLFSLEFLIIALSYGRLQNILLWLWGKIPPVNPLVVLSSSVLIIISFFKILFHYKAISLLAISESMAESKGINIHKVTYEIIIFSTIIVATIVSVCGIIGFVGLVVPHIIRLVIGNDYKKILVLVPLAGGSFLLFSDFISRFLLYPSVMPLGIVTSIIGAPLFFYLLKRNLT